MSNVEITAHYGMLAPDGSGEPIRGLFYTDQDIKLYHVKPKRSDSFLAVYPDALKELDPTGLHTFLNLMELANFDNRVAKSLGDLAGVFNISPRGVEWRLRPLRGKAFKGKVPILFLNPFYASKCGTKLLHKLRHEWILYHDDTNGVI